MTNPLEFHSPLKCFHESLNSFSFHCNNSVDLLNMNQRIGEEKYIVYGILKSKATDGRFRIQHLIDTKDNRNETCSAIK